MTSTSGPPTLSSLPSELLTAIAEPLPQGAKAALCRACRRLRQEVEPLLYQSVTISHVAASGCFQRTVKQDQTRAEWVRALSFEYRDGEEDRGDHPDDTDVLPHLPNLESLTLNTPYHDKKAWADLWERALDPNSSERILTHLKSCFLLFQDDNGEFWGSTVRMDLLGLPSLENLTLAKWEGSGIRRELEVDTKDLPPLKTLIFTECDIHEHGLEEFLQVRRTEALSITKFDEGYPPIEEGLHDLPDYVPVLKPLAGTLTALQWLRYWDGQRQEEAAEFGAMHALRILYINPEVLFGHAYGKGQDDRTQWLQNVLPRNLETILLDFSLEGLGDECTEVLVAALQAKDTVLPSLRRVEFLGMDEEEKQKMRPELVPALEAANVQWDCYDKDYQARWALHTAEQRDLAVYVGVGEVPPWGGEGNQSVVHRFFPRHGVNGETRASKADGEGVRHDHSTLLMGDLSLA